MAITKNLKKMEFTRIINKKFEFFYFIDGKRTTKDKYDTNEILCRMKGMNYNCSYEVKTRKNNRKLVHHFN